MRTPYSTDNAKFSNTAHECAREKIYPALFGVDQSRLAFDAKTLLDESERGRVLDGAMAIDHIVRVNVLRLRQSLAFTIQERFRRPEWAHKRDITITEWNHATNQPSELYKLEANLFVYGYFNEQTSSFIEVVTVNVPALLQAIANNTAPYKFGKNPRSNQSFLALTFDDLAARNLLVFHYKLALPAVVPAPNFVRPASTGGRMAKYDTTCSYCKKPIAKNADQIAYANRYGWIHAKCAAAARAEPEIKAA